MCGGEEVETAFPAAAKRAGSALVRCRRCRLVFQTFREDESSLLSLYSDEYYAHWGVAEDFDGVFDLKRRSARRYLKGLLRQWRGDGADRLLDFGCAFGFLLTVAREIGFEVSGLEVSPAGAYVKRTLGCPVYGGISELNALPVGYFGIITMIDVLEHLPDPLESMRALTRVLKPGGAVLVVTPDVGSAAARLRPSGWPHFKGEHVCYYSASSLSALFSACGMKMVRCRRAARYLTLHYIAGHFQRYDEQTSISGVLRALVGVVPDRVARWPFLVPTELMAIAVK